MIYKYPERTNHINARKSSFSTITALCIFHLINMNVWATQIAITTADGNGADAFVQSSIGSNNAANINFGSEGGILVKHDTGIPGNSRKGYLKFDLSTIGGPATQAALELVYIDKNNDTAANPSTYLVYGLIDGHAGELWNESAITWNNAPANNTSSTWAFNNSQAVFLGSFQLSFPGTLPGYKISFSSQELLNFVNSDTNNLITLMLTRSESNWSIESFSSKENTAWSAPTLNITIPEPATMILLGLGAILLRQNKR